MSSFGCDAALKTDDGCRRVVRHGYLRAPDHDRNRAVAVRQRACATGRRAPRSARIRFTPAILPPYARRSKSLDTLIPILYLKGCRPATSRRRWPPCSARMLVACRLRHRAAEGGLDRRTQAMERARPVGQELRLRWAEASTCRRVWRRGAMHPGHHRRTAEGKKELLGFVEGARESAQTGAPAARSKRRGLSMAPKVAVADGALGFWKAIGELWQDHEQRCWVHKTPTSSTNCQEPAARAKRMLQDIGWRNEEGRRGGVDVFVATYGVRREGRPMSEEGRGRCSPSTTSAEHWKHLRTSDEIDKQFLRSVLFMGSASDSWRSAACRLQARQASYSFLAGLRARGCFRLAFRRAWTPGFDKVLVALLRLLGDAHLAVSEFLDTIGVGGAAPVSLLLRLTGLQLHAAHLVGHRLGRAKGSRSLSSAYADKHREFTRDGDSGNLMATLCTDTDEKRMQWAGVLAPPMRPPQHGGAWLRPPC